MKSLYGRIFRIIILVTFATVLLCGTIFGFTLMRIIEEKHQLELHTEIMLLKNALGTTDDQDEAARLIDSFSTDDVRVTWLDAQGSVLYDSGSSGLVATENHSDRPEFLAAQSSGEGAASRYSSTLGEITYYQALRLDDGTIVRLATTQNAALALLVNLILPGVFILLLIVALAFIIARLLSRRMVSPLLDLDFAKPLANKVYDEVAPLLGRINAQQHRIALQAEESVAARREFTANVSHELKTPLTVISGYAELMMNGQTRPEDNQHFSGLIYSEAEHLKELVESTLILSQLDEAASGLSSSPRKETEIVNLRDLASDCIDRLAPFADQHNVSFHLTVDGAVFVSGLPILLNSMIYNLCENAIRYNKEGGSVDVFVGKSDSGVVFRISDTGIGIAPEDQERIFERFFRVDKVRSRATGGTGLGLAIVKHGAAYHGAELILKSTLGIGTNITLLFPHVP